MDCLLHLPPLPDGDSQFDTDHPAPKGTGVPTMRPRLLDLFCCAGGASTGYHRAGFDVTGVDIAPQPRYPFEFIQADALEYLADHGHEFDAIAASPPCQMYSRAFKHLAAVQPMLIDATLELLDKLGKPYIVENVEGAPLATQSALFGNSGVMVCGTSLGLRVQRHRLFESNVPLHTLPCNHKVRAMNPHNQAGRDLIYDEFGRSDPEVIWRREMGVEWMNKHEGRECVPPAYTQFLGLQLVGHCGVEVHDGDVLDVRALGDCAPVGRPPAGDEHPARAGDGGFDDLTQTLGRDALNSGDNSAGFHVTDPDSRPQDVKGAA